MKVYPLNKYKYQLWCYQLKKNHANSSQQQHSVEKLATFKWKTTTNKAEAPWGAELRVKFADKAEQWPLCETKTTFSEAQTAPAIHM